MEKNEARCMRCHGRKQIFKMGSGYSHVDFGGVKVDCPMCLGKGSCMSIEEFLKEIDNKNVAEDNVIEDLTNAKEKNISKKRTRKAESSDGTSSEIHQGTCDENL